MNFKPSPHPIDVPWGTKAPPDEVVAALKGLMAAASKHGVPFARIIEHPGERARRQFEHENAQLRLHVEKLERLTTRQEQLISEYEKRLGIDDI